MHDLLLIIECSHHHKYKARAVATWNIKHFSCGLTETGPDTRLADNNVAQPHALVVCVSYIVARRAKGGRIKGVIIPPSSALQNYLHLLLYRCAILCQRPACIYFTKFQTATTTITIIATRTPPRGICVAPRCVKIETSVWRQTGERRPTVFLLCSWTRSNEKGIKSLGATELVRRFLPPPSFPDTHTHTNDWLCRGARHKGNLATDSLSVFLSEYMALKCSRYSVHVRALFVLVIETLDR